MGIKVTITGLGHLGHGLATLDGKTIHIPYTAPGDEADITLKRGKRGTEIKLKQVLIPGPDRQTPPCPYFGTCGGCALQHLTPGAYIAFKKEQLATTLAQRGLHVPVADVVTTQPASRQRVRLALRQTGGALVMGFQAFRSHHIIDIAGCAVAHPDLTALFTPLRKALRPILPHGATVDLQLTLTETGVDALLDGDWQLDLTAREALADIAHGLNLARLVVRNNTFTDPVAVRHAPVVTIGGRPVALPVGAFLQASQPSTHALQALVAAGLSGISGRIADLFSGLGTFSLPLAAEGRVVHAVESIADALDAQKAAAHGLPLSTEERDLFEMPLMPDELSTYGAVVLDPPRAGAQAQVQQLAASTVERIVYVSCNPASFARDGRILVDGGYTLSSVTPVDQFLWSAHTELVAAFTR